MKGAVVQGRDVSADVVERCDVCIVGSGAGGAVLAAGLVERGLDVVMLETGGYYTRRDFDLDESRTWSKLYQDRGTRATADQAVSILQGRAVGGSTTINWTTCFRTPDRILEHWRKVHGIEGLDPGVLAPHFEAVEARLGISAWPEELANANNRALLDGCRSLGWKAEPLRRNVRGCANTGFCGLGCPLDAKQAMHVTTIPDAVHGGMRLYSDVSVFHIDVDRGVARSVRGRVLDRETGRPTGPEVLVKAKVVAVCGGAINTPALLLRSDITSAGRVGARTFLHPVVAVVGRYQAPIAPFYGAPQSIGSHEHIDRGPDKVGFFLEAAPLQPMLAATATPTMGATLGAFMADLAHLSGLLALHVDGLVPGDDGGTVSLRRDGRVAVDYPIRPILSEAFQVSHRALARVHLAAGAQRVGTLHRESVTLRTVDDLQRLEGAGYGAHELALFTAHQMGGCPMGPDPETAVVRPDHRHHDIGNLYIVDGSVLPTSLGVNPSETIYGLAHRARDLVAAAV